MEKVAAGQPLNFSAGTWNKFVDTADFVSRMRRLGPGQQLAGVERLYVRNVSGSALPVGGIIRPTGLAACHNAIVFNGDQPTSVPPAFYAVNITMALEPGSTILSECKLFNPAMALFDAADGTPVWGQSWGPENASWKLRKNKSGFLILGKVDVANDLVLVRQSPNKAKRIVFQLTADLTTAMASVSVAVIDYIDGPGTDVTEVWNRASTKNPGKFIHKGTANWTGEAYYDPEQDKYFIAWIEC